MVIVRIVDGGITEVRIFSNYDNGHSVATNAIYNDTLAELLDALSFRLIPDIDASKNLCPWSTIKGKIVGLNSPFRLCFTSVYRSGIVISFTGSQHGKESSATQQHNLLG